MTFEEDIEELINRRRRQILVHSCLYYRFNTSIISDKQFDEWAYQLVGLQLTYPQISAKCVYAKEFDHFDGTTGYDLPTYDVINKAEYLLKIHKKRSEVICMV